MGFGIGLGPRIFRVRVSTRGLGVSSGLGPFSVWANTGSRRRRRPRRNSVLVRSSGVRYLTEPVDQPSVPSIPMTDVTGTDAGALAPTGAGDLVQQLNAAARMPRWPWVLAGSVVGVLAFAALAWLAVALLVVGLVATCVVFVRERPRRRVQVTYDVEGPVGEWFSSVTSGWPTLMRLGGSWRINTEGAIGSVHQHKVNAGASKLVSRSRVSFGLPAPRILVTNVPVPSVTSGSSSLYFLPDRVLVKTRRRWSDVDYSALRMDAKPQRFIEDSAPPRDSQQVGATWQYVNVKGGPDRRYKNNRQLPIMQYGRMELTSGQGLQWIIDVSQPKAAHWLASMVLARPVVRATPAPLVPNRADPDQRRQIAQAPKPTTVRQSTHPVPHQLPGVLTPVSTRGRVSVVGESHYQSAILAVVAGRTVPIAGQWDKTLEAWAALVPEPDNSYDSNAVRVDLASPDGWFTVGYLSRELARDYQPVLLGMSAHGLGWAPARICRSSAGPLAVYLHLAKPEGLVMQNSLPPSAKVLPAVTSAAISGETRHQETLAHYRPKSGGTSKVWATLHPSHVQSGKYSGSPTLEVRFDGDRVGELTAAQAGRFRNVQTLTGVACEAEVYVGSRNIEVRVFLAEA